MRARPWLGLLSVFFCFGTTSVWGLLPIDHAPNSLTYPLHLVSNISLTAFPRFRNEWGRDWNQTYRVGDDWGKRRVTNGQIEEGTAVFRRTAQATGSFRGGTAFYLGRFDGAYVVATNYHVLGTQAECRGAIVRFPWIDLRLACTTLLGAWPDIDLALFVVEPSGADQERRLRDVGRNFAFRADIVPGQRLLTIGFGIADNDPPRAMVANQDSDCKVFSPRNEFRHMADPDALNPGPYRAWSFANGCDVSHGDSGSAMVDRTTGDVLGIIWTAKIPKADRVQRSAFLTGLLDRPGEAATRDIWGELSYAVPARKISEHLTQVVAEPALARDVRDILRALLAN